MTNTNLRNLINKMDRISHAVPRQKSAIINEVFNKPAQWAWTTTNDKAAIAKFTVGEIPYYLAAESYGKKTKKWAIKFWAASEASGDQQYGVTGTGNAGTVMATVVAIVKAFLQMYSSQIQQLTFSAAEKSRMNLYAAMIHRLLPKWTVDKSSSAPPRFFGKGKTATYMFTLTAPPAQVAEAETYQPPEFAVGDRILKGKFKNSPATIKGFSKDKKNQPVLQTDKGAVQLFKPRIQKLMTNEGLQHPVICVDVQPSYNGGGEEANPTFVKIMQFVQNQTGPVLFFVNAEQDGLTEDTMGSIQQFWNSTLGTDGEEGEDENGDYYYNEGESPIDWRRFKLIDKGFGYLRSWMDRGVNPRIMIATIREMYAQKVYSSEDLEFPDDAECTPAQRVIKDTVKEMNGDQMTVGWTSVAQLKRFNGAYIVGGGRDECLREVELLMNAFNIKYKRIDSLVY